MMPAVGTNLAERLAKQISKLPNEISSLIDREAGRSIAGTNDAASHRAAAGRDEPEHQSSCGRRVFGSIHQQRCSVAHKTEAGPDFTAPEAGSVLRHTGVLPGDVNTVIVTGPPSN